MKEGPDFFRGDLVWITVCHLDVPRARVIVDGDDIAHSIGVDNDLRCVIPPGDGPEQVFASITKRLGEELFDLCRNPPLHTDNLMLPGFSGSRLRVPFCKLRHGIENWINPRGRVRAQKRHDQ